MGWMVDGIGSRPMSELWLAMEDGDWVRPGADVTGSVARLG